MKSGVILLSLLLGFPALADDAPTAPGVVEVPPPADALPAPTETPADDAPPAPPKAAADDVATTPPPTAETAVPDVPAKPKKKTPFKFGSYGRVIGSMDTDGGRGETSQVTSFGPRLTESSYLELDFNWKPEKHRDGRVQTTVTIAYGDRFMHYDGKFEAEVAIRQAFVEVQELYGTGAFLWVGSRMFRGDDIYLLNFWPMDELNTMGGAAGWKDKDTELQLHVGANRLEDAMQFQRVPVPAPVFGATDATLLDRQRFIVAARAEERWGGQSDEMGFKIRLYGELHVLPRGERILEDSFTDKEALPNDDGAMVGLQLGLWNYGPRNHTNFWLRYATGLAAYDELQLPTGLGTDRRARDAREFRAAVSGSYEQGAFGLMYGGYVRVFHDADGQEVDFDDRVESSAVIRPMLLLGAFTPAVEISYQVSRPNGVNPRTNEQRLARVLQFGLMPALSFGKKRGTYSRPQIRAIAALSLLNQAALDLYPVDDPRATAREVWFVGVGAEWWFGRGGGY